MRTTLRRLSTLVAAALILSLAFGAGISSAAPTGKKLTREQIATKLLTRQNGRLYSSSARLALLSIAHGGAHEPAEAERGASLGKVSKATGGVAASGTPLSNVRVNDPATDSHQPDQTTQSETAIAVAGNNVVVGYNDSQQTLPVIVASTNLSGVSYSSDGGATFTDGGSLPLTPEFVNFGDPWLASDRAGNFYYSQLQLDYFNGNLDIGVTKSTNGGRTWSSPAAITRPPFDIFYTGDKDAMAIGRDPKQASRDNIYVAWDDDLFDFSTCTDVACPELLGLPVARSIDGGATWQVTYADRVALDFNATGCSFQQYIGANPIVNPKNGDLYVTAERIAVDDPTCEGGTLTFDISAFRSTDGGATFGSRVKIADVTSSFPDGLLKLADSQYIRNLEFPSSAFFNNALYVAWNDGASGNSHIRLGKSTNGSNWTISSATQGSNDEFQPALSADAAGLHLLYYQRNNNNTLDAVAANSTNGTSFTARRVSSQSFPGVSTIPQFDPIIAFGYMGDYIANVSDGTHQYFAWGDNRDRVTNFLWPSGRNDPNVYFAKQ
jgi:hypothetical protein